MDKKEILRALLWAAVVFFAWQMIAVRIWPPVRRPAEESSEQSWQDNGTVPGESGDDANAVDVVGRSPTAVAGPNTESPLKPVAAEPQTFVIGDREDQESRAFGLRLVLTNVGASVVSAELSNYTLSVKKDSPPYPLLAAVPAPDGKAYYSYTTHKIHFHDRDLDLMTDRIPWAVESASANRVVFLLDIQDDGASILRIRKTFALGDTTRHPDRYDLNVTVEVENPTDQEQTVILTRGGAVGVRREDPRMDDRTFYVGTFDAGVVHSSAGLQPGRNGKEKPVYKNAPDTPPLVWTAVANKYFVAFESFGPSPETSEKDRSLQQVEESPSPASASDWIREIWEVPFTTDAPKGNAFSFRETTEPIAVPASGSRIFNIDCYLGPKSRKAFQEVADYVARGYDAQVLASYGAGSCCSFLAFKPLTVLMINVLNWLKVVVFNYGIAIIMLVLIVRILMHPITKKGQVNMMRMQQEMGTLQPKMEDLKKRCGSDKAKYNQEVMKLYQEAGINPATQMFSSCVPMFLQMPIWFALYTSLNYNIDMRHQPFCLWIQDLTAPDALIEFSKTVTLPLLGPVSSLNLLPILVSVSMFLQQKLMPKPQTPSPQASAKSEQSAQMQKMMPYMTLIFGLFFYNMPSGLNLYIGASSFFGTFEQWRIRKHLETLKKQPPAERKAISKEAGAKSKGPKKPSLFQRLQKAAAQAQQIKSHKPPKDKKS